MPTLTRRQSTDAPEECWHVYYGDVHVGTIAIRAGIPHDEDPWGWSCGFYPGSRQGEFTSGSAETFDEARAGFEDAWRVFSAKRTEALPDGFRTGVRQERMASLIVARDVDKEDKAGA